MNMKYNSQTVGAGLALALNHTFAKNNAQGNRAGARPAPTVGNIIGAFKSLTMKKCLKTYKSQSKYLGKLWQRNYFEHIIRNEKSYSEISEYIINNPAQWEIDEFYENNEENNV
jgi:hypothetical protein